MIGFAGIRAKRAEAPLWALIVLLAFTVRVWRLGEQSLWLDEGLSYTLSSQPLAQMLPAIITKDIHPPFYHLALHFWMKMAGSTEFSLRFLSLIFGVLLVPLVYKLAAALLAPEGKGRSHLGLVASSLAALSPFLVYYSQEARNYSALTFWAALSTLALWKGLHPSSAAAPKGRWWLIYMGSTALLMYTHYFGGLILAFHAVYFLATGMKQGKTVILWLMTLLGAGILYLPWVFGTLSQIRRLQAIPDFWAGSISLGQIAQRILVAFSLGAAGEGSWRWLALGLFTLLLGLGALSFWRIRGGLGQSGELYLLFYFLVPLISVYLLSARNPKFAERYLIVIAPAFYLLLARGLDFLASMGAWHQDGRGERRILSIVLSSLFLASLLTASGYMVYRVHYGAEFERDDDRGALAYIQQSIKPGDVLVLMMDTSPILPYYYKGDAPWEALHPRDDLGAAASQLNRLSERYSRLWLLLWNKEWADPTGFALASLDAAAERAVPDRDFKGLEVRAYSLAGKPRFSANFTPQRLLNFNFEDKLELMGYDPPKKDLPSGGSLPITMYWQALRPLDQDYVVSLRLKKDGYYWGHTENRPINYYYPTTAWRVRVPLQGAVPLSSLIGTPPGQYQVEVAVYSVTQGKDLAVLGGDKNPAGTSAVVGTVRVGTAPEAVAVPVPAIPFSNRLGAQFEVGVNLLGVDTPVRDVQGGNSIPLTLFWQARQGMKDDYRVSIEVEDAAGQSFAVMDRLAGDSYPTSHWQTQELVRDQYSFVLPVSIRPGPSRLWVSLRTPTGTLIPSSGEGERILLGTIGVQERPRLMERPRQIQNPTEAVLGDVARLAGYALRRQSIRPGEALELTLYWQAMGGSRTSYAVFAHLVDAQGRIWGQKDSVPQNGSYPTTSWIKDEFVVDDYRLESKPDAPSGQYLVEIGVYDPSTGRRLPVTGKDGASVGDHLVLTSITITR